MTTSVKTCFKCGVEKPITDFYVHQRMRDGRLNKCKECTKKDVSKNYHENVEYFKEYDKSRSRLPHRAAARKKYQQSEAGKQSIRRSHKKFADKYPDKKRAVTAVNNAVRDGRIEKPETCSVCGAGGRIEGHHPDYSKPLDVMWLCQGCHLREHGKEIISPSVMATGT